MILKVRDEQDFNLTMKQNIDCEKGFIELLVTAWDKVAHTTETRVFSAEKFRDALDYYRQKEVEMFNEAEAPQQKRGRDPEMIACVEYDSHDGRMLTTVYDIGHDEPTAIHHYDLDEEGEA